MSDVPDVGDIIWLNPNPQAGREQAEIRPFLVLSPKTYNEKTSLVIGCPITSKVKNYPFEIALSSQSKTKGVVLCDHVKNLDWRARRAPGRKPDKVDKTILEQVKFNIACLLSIQ